MMYLLLKFVYVQFKGYINLKCPESLNSTKKVRAKTFKCCSILK